MALTSAPAKPASHQDELSNGGEPYFWTGPVTYQVQISRQFNPFNTYDVQFLAGVQGAQSISAQQFWFGVFLWAKNQSGHIVKTTDKFELIDSAGDAYTPTALNASVNPFAWSSELLSPDDIEPVADSAASDSSPGGGLILFKLNQSAYSNRPLTLKVFAPGTARPVERLAGPVVGLPDL